MERARMIKVMKTVAAIVEKANTPPMKRLVQMLCNQLLEIMPELADVAPWHTIGQRRTLDEYGRVVERLVRAILAHDPGSGLAQLAARARCLCDHLRVPPRDVLMQREALAKLCTEQDGQLRIVADPPLVVPIMDLLPEQLDREWMET